VTAAGGVAALRALRAWWLVPILVLAGCTAVDAPPPSVGADSMLVEVLTDLYLLEGRTTFDGGSADISSRDSVLALHDLTEATFTKRIEAYRAHPEAFYDLQKEVLERLNLERLDLPITD